MNFQVKKIIALAVTVSLILFTGYEVYFLKKVPTHYISIAMLIVGYYFGEINKNKDNE